MKKTQQQSNIQTNHKIQINKNKFLKNHTKNPTKPQKIQNT